MEGECRAQIRNPTINNTLNAHDAVAVRRVHVTDDAGHYYHRTHTPFTVFVSY